MRIISGSARGTKLYTLDGIKTRPTLDRVKESVFNIIQNEVLDSVFLDLFAGSGAIGLEAASRGAKIVYMCEKSTDAIKIIRKNIEKTHLEEKIVLYGEDYEKMLINRLNERLDIIYIDPPYKTDFIMRAIEILKKEKLLKLSTIIIIETDREEVLKKVENIENILIVDIRKYGRANIIFAKVTDLV